MIVQILYFTLNKIKNKETKIDENIAMMNFDKIILGVQGSKGS